MDELHIVTLAPEPTSFNALGVSYLYADLRELPIADAVYDRVLSISTLEHVGMDTSHFGAASDTVPEPRPELLRAVAELRRVLKPGGDCYVTVPVGRPERFAWVRALSHDEVDELVDAFGPARAAVRYFAYGADGWQPSTREATADVRYRDHLTSGPPGSDRRVAAGAVACVHLVKG
jgi:SAM-dependent methyltransferase